MPDLTNLSPFCAGNLQGPELSAIASGEMSVKQLAEPFNISAPSITKHLKVLERAGLVRRSRNAQLRPCRLAADPLKEVSEWVEQYREFWAGTMNRLDNYLGTLQSLEVKKKHAGKKKRRH